MNKHCEYIKGLFIPMCGRQKDSTHSGNMYKEELTSTILSVRKRRDTFQKIDHLEKFEILFSMLKLHSSNKSLFYELLVTKTV